VLAKKIDARIDSKPKKKKKKKKDWRHTQRLEKARQNQHHQG